MSSRLAGSKHLSQHVSVRQSFAPENPPPPNHQNGVPNLALPEFPEQRFYVEIPPNVKDLVPVVRVWGENEVDTLVGVWSTCHVGSVPMARLVDCVR